MDVLDDEILSLWKSLSDTDVKYIMVGGFATNLHGFSRTTGDLDIWIEDTSTNRKKLRKALENIGLGDMSFVETMEFVPGWSSIKLNSGFELDIMTYMKGFTQLNFEECYQASPSAIVQNIPIKFLHLNFLIQEKKACGRPKDLIDLIELERIQKL